MFGDRSVRSVGYPDRDADRSTHRRGARTREALLDAGVAVAESQGLSGLSVNRVVAQAGVAKGTFYVHFEDRKAFVDALHARFHDRVDEAVGAAIAGTSRARSPRRRCRGLPRHLPRRPRRQGARARGALGPDLATSMSRRHERFAASAVPSFRAMDWPDATAASHLFAAMTAEIAIRELEAGRRLPAARRSLRRFLGL